MTDPPSSKYGQPSTPTERASNICAGENRSMEAPQPPRVGLSPDIETIKKRRTAEAERFKLFTVETKTFFEDRKTLMDLERRNKALSLPVELESYDDLSESEVESVGSLRSLRLQGRPRADFNSRVLDHSPQSEKYFSSEIDSDNDISEVESVCSSRTLQKRGGAEFNARVNRIFSKITSFFQSRLPKKPFSTDITTNVRWGTQTVTTTMSFKPDDLRMKITITKPSGSFHTVWPKIDSYQRKATIFTRPEKTKQKINRAVKSPSNLSLEENSDGCACIMCDVHKTKPKIKFDFVSKRRGTWKTSPIIPNHNNRSPTFQNRNDRSPTLINCYDCSPTFQNRSNRSPIFQNRKNRSPIYQNHVNRSPIYQNPVNRSPIYQNRKNRSPIYQNSENRSPIFQNQDNRSAIFQSHGNRSPIYRKDVTDPISTKPKVDQMPNKRFEPEQFKNTKAHAEPIMFHPKKAILKRLQQTPKNDFPVKRKSLLPKPKTVEITKKHFPVDTQSETEIEVVDLSDMDQDDSPAVRHGHGHGQGFENDMETMTAISSLEFIKDYECDICKKNFSVRSSEFLTTHLECQKICAAKSTHLRLRVTERSDNYGARKFVLKIIAADEPNIGSILDTFESRNLYPRADGPCSRTRVLSGPVDISPKSSWIIFGPKRRDV